MQNNPRIVYDRKHISADVRYLQTFLRELTENEKKQVLTYRDETGRYEYNYGGYLGLRHALDVVVARFNFEEPTEDSTATFHYEFHKLLSNGRNGIDNILNDRQKEAELLKTEGINYLTNHATIILAENKIMDTRLQRLNCVLALMYPWHLRECSSAPGKWIPQRMRIDPH